MERLKRINPSQSACFTCPAKIFADGEYCCDPSLLIDRNIVLTVARYKPISCPEKEGVIAENKVSPEILLRKILHK